MKYAQSVQNIVENLVTAKIQIQIRNAKLLDQQV